MLRHVVWILFGSRFPELEGWIFELTVTVISSVGAQSGQQDLDDGFM